ncbi:MULTISPECIES: pyridoxamine 5'-phosphate oxidase family protein [Citricoccus]|uniref:pyridoxamine 5'-phosphate oxidase family protein n=1 Tax=Citricoccus TaxID=169133 RepID=UPI000255F6F3|nr:pyridoxamine 5'-phosphate oxidase family protein [Citricoccus sp. CH26A]
MTEQPAAEEHLSEDACWERLRQAPVGRLGVWVQDHPEVFPVTFTVDGRTILFRSGPGTKLDAVLSGTPVAFEADALEATTSIVWSVMVRGRAEQITRSVELMETGDLPLRPWHPGDKTALVRITPTEVTGRRFPIADPEWWRSVAADVRRPEED